MNWRILDTQWRHGGRISSHQILWCLVRHVIHHMGSNLDMFPLPITWRDAAQIKGFQCICTVTLCLITWLLSAPALKGTDITQCEFNHFKGADVTDRTMYMYHRTSDVIFAWVTTEADIVKACKPSVLFKFDNPCNCQKQNPDLAPTQSHRKW